MQATALTDVNSAINQMDEFTQQNAAMVEQSTAASRSLAQEASGLAGLIGRFKVDGAPGPAAARQAEPPASRSARQSASVAQPRRAKLKLVNDRKGVAADDGWQEF